MKSVLLLGQSNMAGRGFAQETLPIYNENLFMLRNGRWQMMVEPIHFDRPTAGVGLAASFAQAWSHANKNEQLGLIPCAEGGSTIDEWNIHGSLFRHAVYEAKFAMENSEIIAVLWHQGESDSSQGKYQEYYTKLDTIINTLRQKLQIYDVPVILGGLADFLGKDGFGAGCNEYEYINKELYKYAENNKNCYFVTGKKLYSNPDGIHINAESLRRFGIRYFEAFQSASNIDEPLDNETMRVNELCQKEHSPAIKRYLAIEEFSKGNITFEEVMTKIKE